MRNLTHRWSQLEHFFQIFEKGQVRPPPSPRKIFFFCAYVWKKIWEIFDFLDIASSLLKHKKFLSLELESFIPKNIRSFFRAGSFYFLSSESYFLKYKKLFRGFHFLKYKEFFRVSIFRNIRKAFSWENMRKSRFLKYEKFFKLYFLKCKKFFQSGFFSKNVEGWGWKVR